MGILETVEKLSNRERINFLNFIALREKSPSLGRREVLDTLGVDSEQLEYFEKNIKQLAKKYLN